MPGDQSHRKSLTSDGDSWFFKTLFFSKKAGRLLKGLSVKNDVDTETIHSIFTVIVTTLSFSQKEIVWYAFSIFFHHQKLFHNSTLLISSISLFERLQTFSLFGGFLPSLHHLERHSAILDALSVSY